MPTCKAVCFFLCKSKCSNMDGWLSDRARQGHNLGPGSILGAKWKKRGEMAKIGKQSEPSGKPARLGSAHFALCLLTPSPPFPPARILWHTRSHFPCPSLLPYHYMVYMLWFNFILGLNFTSFCFGEW